MRSILQATAQSERKELVRVLGEQPTTALLRWADTNGRSVRLAQPPWQAAGYTGAILTAINVSQPGGADTKLVLKVCPPGPYADEAATHRQALAASAPPFVRDHLVHQPFDPYPVGDGGHLMFQDIAGATFEHTPLLEVPDEEFHEACSAVIHGILRDWSPSTVRTLGRTAADFLDAELPGAVAANGSVHRWAAPLGLLEQDSAWLVEVGEPARPLPNPVLMLAGRLGGDVRFDVSVGASHGDLHLENVLIPSNRGRLWPEEFRLVDLSAFRPDAPLSRDPVTLMLSVIAQSVANLRLEEQEALLHFILEPWSSTSGSARLSAYLTTAIKAIYNAGYDSFKVLRQGSWRSQFLLSVQATALQFACYETLDPAARWWFFRLAAYAGRAFLLEHRRYLPAPARQLLRPTVWPSALPAESAESPGRRLESTDRKELIDLLAGIDFGSVSDALNDLVPAGRNDGRGAATDVEAALREVESRAVAPAEVPAALVLADRTAHLVGGVMSRRIHAWLEPTAMRYKISRSALRTQVCQVSERFVASRNRPVTGFLSQSVGGSGSDDSSPHSVIDLFPDDINPPGDTAVNAPTTADPLQAAPQDSRATQRRLIFGPALPAKNPNFTGRENLLTRLSETLLAGSQAAVVPQTLHGLGGVGKTQLAVEFVYRHAGDYDLIWWIPAEDPAQVRLTLAELAGRLTLPAADDVKQTISLLFEYLAREEGTKHWLLVYDNVNNRADLAGLIPPAGGGHVIITSRNTAEFATDAGAIEVDIFERQESIELLQRHGQSISDADADLLAEKLGDLPLALEQAAIWNAQTKMPVSEYLQLFDRNIEQLLSEGRPVSYPETVFAIVKLAVRQLRDEAPGAAELLEAFAFFGAEPVAVSMLHSGRNATLSPDLANSVRNQIELNRAIRKVNAYGLVKITDSNGQRLQVHRLVQRVLHEELVPERRDRARLNVQNVLAAANPREPDVVANWPIYANIGPHIAAADLISAESPESRYVVLDQIRCLFVRGDYEASRHLGRQAYDAWTAPEDPLGADHEITLIAGRNLANAYRGLGKGPDARELDLHIFKRLSEDPRFGIYHEHTLYTANNVSNDLRILGDYNAAREHDELNVERHTVTFGADDDSTLRARSNLAVNLRFLGKFAEAEEIDRDIFEKRRVTFGDNNVSTQVSLANLALDLLGLGRYAAALEIQRKGLPIFRDLLSPQHSSVLKAVRTITIALRRTGSYADARDNARENYRDHQARFGEDHENTLAAALTYANTLRACNEYSMARSMIRETVSRYRRLFGPSHALTLAANINTAIILRKVGDDDAEARRLAENSLTMARTSLGNKHPVTFAAGTALANSLAAEGDAAGARELSVQAYEGLLSIFGPTHPETLLAAVNASIDLQIAGDSAGSQLFDQARRQLREVLGPEHPVVTEIGGGERTEIDIESSPS